jgi:hypothetical protein
LGGHPVSNTTPAIIANAAINAMVIFFARGMCICIIYGELKILLTCAGWQLIFLNGYHLSF